MARRPFDPNLIEVPSDEGALAAGRGRLTVSQVTALVKQALESALPRTIHVVGEISNFKRHSSGHLYLTLKDRFSELSCVMWRSAAEHLKFSPTDGLEVIATGKIEVFERAGRYQLYIRKLEPRGVGALELAFRQLCEKLSREGLFDEGRKRPIPTYPERIALVTSPTGAAVADMLRTIQRRYPCLHVLIHPVRVQGPGAAEEIAAAIRQINDNATLLNGVDVIIVGRGGGSLEDLWAFNEETVARAIYASRIPIISAVGHEVDVTIADLVADVRAATPTTAAELAVPMREDVLAELAGHGARLLRAMRQKVDLLTAHVYALLQRGPFREPLYFVNRRGQLIDELVNRIRHSLLSRVQVHRRGLDRVEPVIQRIAPHAILLRRAVQLGEAEHRLRWSISHRLAVAERSVSLRVQRLERSSPVSAIPLLSDRVARVAHMIPAAMRHRLLLHRECVRSQEKRLQAMSHKSVIGRGFSITRNKKDRKVVRSVKPLRDGQRLVTETGDGEFESYVINLKQLELFG